MASFKFHTNPFSSPVGQRIERATDSILPSEDWALFIEICDIINDTEEGAKDAVKAIKKRLSNKKDYKSLMYTLTLLESCVKNCGNRFHVIVANKDVLGDLTKILTPKGTVSQIPQIVEEKILMLVQSWSDAFRNSEQLQAFVRCHEHLKAQGYEFPAQDIDSLAPIHTPKRTVPESNTPRPASANQLPSNNGQPMVFPPAVQRTNSGPTSPTPTQLAKLRGDLNTVEENVRVMSEMLTALSPEQEESDDMNLLKELNSTCRQMQQRVIELLQKVANDEVTGELLRVNDLLNNVFIRYDRFERNRSGFMSSQSQPSTAVATDGPGEVVRPAAASGNSADLLIDFGDAPTSAPPQSVQKVPDDDEFDMFAQTRNSSFADSRKNGSTYEDNINNVPTESFSGAIASKAPYVSATDKDQKGKSIEDDMQDVEEWLKDVDLNKIQPTNPPPPQDAASPESTEGGKKQDKPLTSDEFDRFLAERSVVGQERIASTRGNSGAPRQMQLMAGETQEEGMFAL
ncbi:target of Myb1 membrane trafficking protein-like [Rhopilema esculentum]|uniref:target of Myb1 membrane trafficking protein-like n=1 Tax=Rhopilema esculentum TaxID=499914 RepID=UPI0031D2A3DE